MLNIEFRGKCDNDEQLIQGKELPENAVRFNEGEKVSEVFKQGMLVSIPIMLPMIILSILRVSEIAGPIDFDSDFAIAAITTMILGITSLVVHEFIHAILYPKDAIKSIWKDSKNNAYFLYCDALVSKRRFIVLSIAPAIVLGIVPFIIWYIVAPIISLEWVVCTMLMIWWMTFDAIGDYANVFNAIRQVPKNARIFNYGVHSYWIE